MKYLLMSVFMSVLVMVPQLLARSLTSPKPVRVVSGCYTVNNQRICPAEIRRLVMHDDVFLLMGGKVVNHIQCQSNIQSQVSGNAVYCVGQPGHQQVAPPHGGHGHSHGIGGQQPNPVGGVPGVGKIVVP